MTVMKRYRWIRLTATDELHLKVSDYDLQPSELYRNNNAFTRAFESVFEEASCWVHLRAAGFRKELRHYWLQFTAKPELKKAEFTPPGKAGAPPRKRRNRLR